MDSCSKAKVDQRRSRRSSMFTVVHRVRCYSVGTTPITTQTHIHRISTSPVAATSCCQSTIDLESGTVTIFIDRQTPAFRAHRNTLTSKRAPNTCNDCLKLIPDALGFT